MTGKEKNTGYPYLLPCVFVSSALAASMGAVRFCREKGLSFRGMMAMTGYSGLRLPDWFTHLILGRERNYANLPAILTEENGKPVLTPEDYEARRKELLQMYQTYMYGRMPGEQIGSVEYRLIEEDDAFHGKGRRSQVKMTVSAEMGEISSMLLIYRPKGRPAKGFFVGENFKGNTAVSNDVRILPSIKQAGSIRRGSDEMFPVERILDAGYAVATMYYQDWENDGGNKKDQGLLEITGLSDSTAYSAWAQGIIFAVDYLKKTYPADAETIAAVGHSRLARAALWAGASDNRIDLTIDSCGGGYMRGPIIGKITSKDKNINWTTKAHDALIGRDEELPVDMNVLFALIAGRRLYVSMGDSDLAADPYSMLEALQNAKQVWSRVFGMGVIADCGYYEIPRDQMIMSESIGCHVHRGGHEISALDWEYYVRYMDYIVMNRTKHG